MKLEFVIKNRIRDFFNIFEDDYFFVLIVNRILVFRLFVELYLFENYKKLLIVYDYESELVEVMISILEKRGG